MGSLTTLKNGFDCSVQVTGYFVADKPITLSPFFDTANSRAYMLIIISWWWFKFNKGCDGTLTALSQLGKEGKSAS